MKEEEDKDICTEELEGCTSPVMLPVLVPSPRTRSLPRVYGTVTRAVLGVRDAVATDEGVNEIPALRGVTVEGEANELAEEEEEQVEIAGADTDDEI